MALTQISTDGVKNDAVTAGKIPANAVGTSEISDNAVTQAQIAGESVDEAKMNISNAGSNGQFLQKQSGNTGGLTWATPADNVVGGATGVDFNDTVKTRWGTDNDLEIFHDGSNGVIRDAGDGDLYFQSDGTFFFRKVTSAEDMAKFIQDGAVELYYDNSKKLETFSWGIQNYGNVAFRDSDKATFGGAEDLKIYHDGSNTYLQNATNTLYIKGDALRIRSYSVNEMQISADVNGTVALAYDGVQKFETLSNGVKVTGNIELLESGSDVRIKNDGGKLVCGAGDDLQIYHDSSVGIIDAASGNLEIRHGAEKMIACANDGQVELYYDGSKMLETVSTGAKVSGKLEVTDDLNLTGASYNALWDKSANQFKVNDSASIALGNDADCKIYHDGGSTWILNNLGHFYIRNNVDGDDGSNIYIQAKSGEGSIACIHDDAVYLYYDGTKKFETLSTGAHIATDADLRFANGTWTGDTSAKIQHHGNSLYIQGGSNGFIFRSSGGVDRWRIDADGHWVPQSNNSYDIGTSSYRVKNLYVNDAHFSNKGSQNSVDGTWGDWTLQEGEDDIFMLNNRTGKKYKMALQEVS